MGINRNLRRGDTIDCGVTATYLWLWVCFASPLFAWPLPLSHGSIFNLGFSIADQQYGQPPRKLTEIAVGRPRSPNSSPVRSSLKDDPTGLELLSSALEEDNSSGSEQESAASEGKPSGSEQESTEGVWRCSCGQNLLNIGGLGGRIVRQKDKANQESLGFRPPVQTSSAPVQTRSKPVQATLTPAQTSSTPAQNVSNPAQSGSTPVEEAKPQVKGKKAVVEKTGRTSTDIDEASLIVVSPFVLYLWDDHQSCGDMGRRNS